MDKTARHSLPARLSAIGFIIVILAGNAWLCFALMGIAVPEAVSIAFAVGIVVALSGGAGLALLAVRRRLAGPVVASDEAGDQG